MLCRGRSERLTNNWGDKREGAGRLPLLSPEERAAHFLAPFQGLRQVALFSEAAVNR
jgi:hypothetical protein